MTNCRANYRSSKWQEGCISADGRGAVPSSAQVQASLQSAEVRLELLEAQLAHLPAAAHHGSEAASVNDGSIGVADAAAGVAQPAQNAAGREAMGERRPSAAFKSSELVDGEQQPGLAAERPSSARRQTSDDAEHHATGGLPWCRLPLWMSAVPLSDEDRFAAVSSCLRRFQSGKQTCEQNICGSVTPATIKTSLHYWP